MLGGDQRFDGPSVYSILLQPTLALPYEDLLADTRLIINFKPVVGLSECCQDAIIFHGTSL